MEPLSPTLPAADLTDAVPQVYQSICAITADLSKVGIPKDQRNVTQKYAFRGIDDTYAALSTLLAKHSLCILPRVTDHHVETRQSTSGNTLIYTTVRMEYDLVCAVDGSKHTVAMIGEAMDSGDKSGNKAQSAAFKYMAFQTFCIPVEGQEDADAVSHEIIPSLDPDTFEKHQQAIEAAADLKQLKSAFAIAYKAALAIGDTVSVNLFTKAKDARKAQLDTPPPAVEYGEPAGLPH